MRQCKRHLPHLINVATLPCESQYTKNVILRRDITKENCIRCIIAFINVNQGHHVPYIYLLIWGVRQQSVHETKIHDIDDLRKRLMQTCFDFDRTSLILA